MLKRIPPILLCAYFFFFLLPLILASVSRPFGWWDWLTVPKGMLGDEPLNPGIHLLKWAYHLNLAYSPFMVRPTTALFYYASYLLFHGEFWAWYLVKWAGFFMAVWWSDCLLKRFEVDQWTRLLVASLLLFHPASFVLMLFSPDGWAALWILGVVLLAFRLAPPDKNPLDLTQYSIAGYGIFLLIAWLAAGIKEIVVIFLMALAALAHWSSGWSVRAFVRVVPLYAMGTFYFWRMWKITQVRDRTSSGTVWPNLLYHLEAIPPPSPYYVFAFLLGAALLYAAWLIFSPKEDKRVRAGLLLSLSAGAAMLVFTSMVKIPAVRYVIPVLYVIAFPLAIAASRLPSAWNIPKIALALLIPLFAAGDQFAQTLAYQRLFFEKASVINLVERRALDGYEIAAPSNPDDLPLEYQSTLRFFFTRYRGEFYGLSTFPKVYKLGTETPQRAYLVVAKYGLESSRWVQPGFHFDTIDTIDTGRHGFLEALTNRFLAFDKAIHNDRIPHFDTGAPQLVEEPAFQVVYFEPDRSESKPEQTAMAATGKYPAEWANFVTGQKQSIVLERERSYHYSFGPKERGIVRVPLGPITGNWRIELTGSLHARHGTISVGVGDDQGHDLWNTPVQAKGASVAIPQPPLLSFPRGRNFSLFFFVPSGADFDLAGLSIVKRPVSRPSLFRLRHYGAFGY